MAATNDFPQRLVELDAPATHAAAVTPDDANDLAHASRALLVGTSGDVKVDTLGGETAVTITGVPAGYLLLRVTRVYSTGTTASGITALW